MNRTPTRMFVAAVALLLAGTQSMLLAQSDSAALKVKDATDAAKLCAEDLPKRSIGGMVRRAQRPHCEFDARTALSMQRTLEEIKKVIAPSCTPPIAATSSTTCAPPSPNCVPLDSLTAAVQKLNATLELTNMAIGEMGKAVSAAIREPKSGSAVSVEATLRPQDVIPVRIVGTRSRRRWVEQALVGSAGIVGGVLIGRRIGR